MANLAILGHEGHGKTTVAAALARLGAPFAVADPVDWSRAAEWNGAILVVSAPDGPLQGTRDAVINATGQGVTRMIVYLTKVDQLEDSELLDLVAMEVTELIAKHGPRGQPIVVSGSGLAALEGDPSPLGEPSIVQLIAAARALAR